LHVLCRILNHARSKWPLLPELRIGLHLAVDLVLLGVDLAQIFLQEVVKADVDVSVVIQLKEIRNQPVGDLGVKHKVADQVVLADEC
jgi:hypothetical protein